MLDVVSYYIGMSHVVAFYVNHLWGGQLQNKRGKITFTLNMLLVAWFTKKGVEETSWKGGDIENRKEKQTQGR